MERRDPKRDGRVVQSLCKKRASPLFRAANFRASRSWIDVPVNAVGWPKQSRLTCLLGRNARKEDSSFICLSFFLYNIFLH